MSAEAGVAAARHGEAAVDDVIDRVRVTTDTQRVAGTAAANTGHKQVIGADPSQDHDRQNTRQHLPANNENNVQLGSGALPENDRE